MSEKRIRRPEFDPTFDRVGIPMYWLSKRGVHRSLVAEIFERTVNDVSVNSTNKGNAGKPPKPTVLPASPNLTLVEPEVVVPDDLNYDDKESKIEKVAARFWEKVRGLAGTAELGESLRSVNKPGRENIQLLRLRGRAQHLLTEMYLHAGYLAKAQDYCGRCLGTRLNLYNQTHSHADLFAYAKSLLLLTSALQATASATEILTLLKQAEQAFEAAAAPIDPELYRQRATCLLRMGQTQAARVAYCDAYKSYPEHREYMGLSASDYARHDVGIRPLAILDESFDQALKNLSVAEQWPEGDIHRSINLNAAIATAFLTDSTVEQKEIMRQLPEARLAASGYGSQTSTVRLLGLLPQIPKRLQHDWALFALRYNAYWRK